jgi:hypothetical protein
MNKSRLVFTLICLLFAATSMNAQERPSAARSAANDPAEPPHPLPKAKPIPRAGGAIARSSVDEKSMRALIDSMVACGTRIAIGDWEDPKHGPGCGRD